MKGCGAKPQKTRLRSPTAHIKLQSPRDIYPTVLQQYLRCSITANVWWQTTPDSSGRFPQTVSFNSRNMTACMPHIRTFAVTNEK